MKNKLSGKLEGQRIGLVKTFSVLLLLFYTFTTMAFFYTCYHFVKKSKAENRKERRVLIEQTLTSVENELSNYYLQSIVIYEKAASDYGFASADVLEKTAAKRNITNDLVGITRYNPKIKMISYTDEENDVDLHDYNCTAKEREVIDGLLASDLLHVGNYMDPDWNYIEYEGHRYLYLMNRNGYTCMVGLVRVNDLFEQNRQLILSEQEGFIVRNGEEQVYVGEYKKGSFQENLSGHKSFERTVADTSLIFDDYYRSFIVKDLFDSAVLTSFFVLIVELCFAFYSYLFMKRFFVKPLQKITGVMKAVEDGDYQIRANTDEANTKEALQLSKTFNRMLDEVVNLRMESYEQVLREQNNSLARLRSQLRPHFYLNAINTINSMTYKENNEEHIRDYLFALSTHMRFMMRMNVNTVTLADELKNVEAYIKLQEFKSECTYNYYIDCEEDLKQVNVPYLILYTFIDNVFKYGIKTKDSFFVMIECHKGTMEDGTPVVILAVEDNGSGFSKEYLKLFEKNELRPKEDGYIGLYNIKKTLELLYKRNDLMHLENTLTGARVEVRLIDESIAG